MKSEIISQKTMFMTLLLTNFKTSGIFQKIVIILSLTGLIISLTQPAFYIGRIDYDAYANSTVLFFLGWTGIFSGSLESLIWLANPVYFIALYLFIKDNKLSLIMSGAATFLALLFATFPTILTSESGARSKITSFELGYKLWVTSFLILFIGTIINRTFKKPTN
jgi:hypothetical protein